MNAFTLTGGDLDEAEAAAAIAAVTCLLDEEAARAAAAQAEATPDGWRDAARLIAQGLIPTRVPATPRWGSIERLRRAGRGGSGVVGQ
jgi:hypothetical protein